MKRRLLVVWLLVLASVAGVAMCGSAGYRKGYTGGYGSQAGYARGGGGQATWDTVTVMFSPDALADSAGTNLFIVPTTDTPDAADQARVYRLNDIIKGRLPGGTVGAPADTIHRLGTGFQVTNFAVGNIDYADTNGYKTGNGYTNTWWSPSGISSAGNSFLSMNMLFATRKTELVYIPFQKYIPANSTIVSAVIDYSFSSTVNIATTDTVIATLMTNPNDNKWYLVKGTSSNPDYAHASWSHQEDVNIVTGSPTWSGTERYAWNPSLYDRPKFWDWGTVSDWTGNTASTVTKRAAFRVKITNCVQAIVNGSVNNGIAVNLADLSENAPSHYQWDDTSNAANRTPCVIVKYITKRYTPPFGSAEWSFTFQSDDGRYAANQMWADTLATYGGKMTMYIAENQLDNSSGANIAATATQMLHWRDLGHEVGSHSKWHAYTQQYVKRIRKGWTTGTGVGSTAYDSLVVDTSPNWMYAKADSLGRDLRNDPYYGKSFGVPTAQIGGYYQRALIDHGYASIRGLSTNLTYDREKYYAPPASFDLSAADSMMSGAPTQYGRHARNMRIIVPWDSPSSLCGPDSSRTDKYAAHLDSVTNAFKRLVFTRIGNDTRSVVLFAHDRKPHNGNAPNYGTPAGLDNTGNYTGYGAGNLDADELGALCRVVRAWNGRYMTSRELADWYASGSTAIDHPFNASRSDTFEVYASDQAWYKPDGIDNRWIRGVRPRNIAAAYDVTAPSAPTNLIYVGQNNSVYLQWTASVSPDAVSYKVYRYFDGADTTLVASGVQTNSYSDVTAINGSHHNYFVTTVDGAGKESQDSNHVQATPGTILAMQRPVYWSFWYQDPDVSTFAQATIDSLALYDAIITGPFALEGPTGEPAYTAGDSLINRLRTVNPDEMLLTYWNANLIPADVSAYPAGSAMKRIWNYCASLPDSGGFAQTDADGAEHNVANAAGTYFFYNVTAADLADTIAYHLVEVYETSGVSAQYTGFFLDDADTNIIDYACVDGDCAGIIDYDQDGTLFSADDGEKAALKNFHVDLVKAIRREFAQRGMKNRLLVSNTTFGRKDEPNDKDYEYMSLLDGALNESWNKWGWPGYPTIAQNATTDQSKWYSALLWRTMLDMAQTSPPLMLWNADVDSSAQYMNEVLAGAYGGWIGAQTDGDKHGLTSAPTMQRRLPNRGIGSISFQAGASSADTLTVTNNGYKNRMILSPAYEDSSAVWPYIIFNPTTHDTLSISKYWERGADVGAPPAPQISINAGGAEYDNFNELSFGESSPGDFDHFNLYRALDGDNTYAAFKTGITAYVWRDSTAANDSTYWYYATAVDAVGNESTASDHDFGVPQDVWAPGALGGVTASGGPGCVVLDWNTSGAPDFASYGVYRANLFGGSFALLASRSIKTNSFLNDSTAVSSQGYRYYVTQTDDDGNTSENSAQVVGGWIAPLAGAPTSLVCRANYPQQQQTTLDWAEPDDLTNFVRYRVYRDTTLPLTFADRVDSTTSPTWVDADATYDVTYYYEVKALYSPGGLSDPTNTASNTNLDTYPPTAPVLQVAAGNGATGIDLNWSDVTGASMYYVWRGVGSASAKIDSSATSLYTDATAVQGTTYTYGVKARDGAWNMSAMSNTLTASWTAAVGGDPAIATVTGGTLQNGEAVTLAGANFGTKAAATPWLFDDFERGADGDIISTTSSPVGNKYWYYYKGPDAEFPSPTNTSWFDKDVKKNGTGSLLNHDTSSASTSVAGSSSLRGINSDEIFLSYWIRFSNYSSAAGVYKIDRMTSGRSTGTRVCCGGSGTAAYNAPYDSPPNIGWGFTYYMNNANYYGQEFVEDYISDNRQPASNTWIYVEMYYKFSDLGVANGSYMLKFNNLPVRSSSSSTFTMGYGNVMTRAQYADPADKIQTWLAPMCANNAGTVDMWVDDLYVDTTQARVVLGNASTYAACTYFAPQIPTAWTTGSISITVNTGSFANDTAYLFVIKSDGTVSAGKQVTISN